MVWTYMEQWTGSKLGKEHIKVIYCHLAYLICVQVSSCEMPFILPCGWSTRENKDFQEKYQEPQTCRWHYPYGRKQRTKEPLDESAGLEFNVQKSKITAFCPITPWQIDGETMETVINFIFLGTKNTAAMKLKNTCSLEEKIWQT